MGLGIFLRMGLATLLAAQSYQYHWWGPSVVFPLTVIIIPVWPTTVISFPGLLLRRWCFYLFILGYTVAQVVIFEIHVSIWFGWILGVLLGWFVGGLLAGKLEPKLLHREFK